jgi:hypothetical protein
MAPPLQRGGCNRCDSLEHFELLLRSWSDQNLNRAFDTQEEADVLLWVDLEAPAICLTEK